MVRIFKRTDGFDPMDLLHSSYDHHRAAMELFKGSPSFFDSAGYLAHLSVELLLKAWLLHEAGQFPGHHLVCDLHATLVADYGAIPLTPEEAGILMLLDQYEQLRYPNRNDPVEVGTERVQDIHDFVMALRCELPQALQEQMNSVNPLEKGGRVLMKRKIGKGRA